MSEIAKIELEGKTYEFPVITGTENEKAIDISKLRDTTGYVTLDTGYKNTGATKSAITFLDGEKGILHYRGYPIEQLAEKATFIEVAYLLIYGTLPTQAQLDSFSNSITKHTLVHEDMKQFFEAYPSKAHPVGVLASLYPKNEYDYCGNFLHMMFAMPTEDYKIDPVVVSALNKLLILHADHEQNCSTSTVRIVGSSQANLYATISAGISALWGPLHGGANQAVIEMLEKIHNDGGDVDKWVAKAKDKDDSFRLMGFGHRVYKNFDPRATIIKKACDDVLEKMGINDPMLEIAKKLEKVALEDEYFKARNLYPNVDFYSGIIYRALGIPTEMFTVMFALGRLPGWVAQWKEMTENNEPIGRPRQIYTGETPRDYVDIAKR